MKAASGGWQCRTDAEDIRAVCIEGQGQRVGVPVRGVRESSIGHGRMEPRTHTTRSHDGASEWAG